METQRQFRPRYILLIIVIIAAVLASWGIRYGLPFHLVGDEESLIGGALHMIELKTLVPATSPEAFLLLYYPPVIPYIIIVASSPAVVLQWLLHSGSLDATRDYFALNQNAIWLSARIAAAIVSLGTLMLTYAIAKRLYNTKVALVAVSLFATSFFFVNVAHWSKHWVYATFFTYCVWWLVVRYVQDKRGARWLPGLIAGVGTGASSIVGFGTVFVLLWAWWHRKQIRLPASYLVINVALWIAVGGLLTLAHVHYVAKEYSFLLGGASQGLTRLSEVFSLRAVVADLSHGYLSLLQHEIVLFVAGLLGLLFARRYVIQNRTIWIVVFVYFFLLHFLFHFEIRYVYILLPLLAMSAGSFAEYLWTEHSRPLALVAGVMLIGYSLAVVIQYDLLLARPDTRNEVGDWIEEIIGSEEFILSSPSILVPREQSALEREERLSSLRASERYLLQNYERLSPIMEPKARYTNLHFWPDHATLDTLGDYLETYRPRYFVLEYWGERDITSKAHSLRAGSKLVTSFRQSDSLRNNYDITGNFDASNFVFFFLERAGPVVEVYELYD